MSILLDGSIDITLPNPDFNENYKLSLRTRFKRNMLGILHSIVRPVPYWTITFTWSNLTRVKILEFFNWLDVTAGELMTLTDHNNDSFEGRIITTNPSSSISSRGHGSDTRKEDGNFSIIFEGNKS